MTSRGQGVPRRDHKPKTGQLLEAEKGKWLSLSFYNKIPQTQWLKQQAFISQSPGGRKFETSLPVWSVSSCRWWTSRSSHLAERTRELFWGFCFIKPQFQSWGPHLHVLITSQMPNLLIPSPWELEFQHMNLGAYVFSIYRQSPNYDGLTYDCSAFWSCKGVMLSVGTVLWFWILIFSWASGMCYDTVSWLVSNW